MLVADRSAMSNYVKSEAARLTGWSPAKSEKTVPNSGY
jgi:hypothetical protein